jgi:ribose transport system permease protein
VTAGSSNEGIRWRSYVPTPRRVSAVYLFIVIFVVFGAWIPDIFLRRSSIEFVLSTQAVVGVIALAALVPLIAGVLDFSVGSLLGLSLVVMTVLSQHHVNWVLSAVIAVGVCAIPGLISV